jgi:hypothetical protein
MNDVWLETTKNIADPHNGAQVIPSPTKTDTPSHLGNDMVFDVLDRRQFSKQQTAIPCNHDLFETMRIEIATQMEHRLLGAAQVHACDDSRDFDFFRRICWHYFSNWSAGVLTA